MVDLDQSRVLPCTHPTLVKHSQYEKRLFGFKAAQKSSTKLDLTGSLVQSDQDDFQGLI